MISQIDRHSIATPAVRCTSDDYNLCAFRSLQQCSELCKGRGQRQKAVAGSRDLIPGGIHQPPHRPDLALPHRSRTGQ